MKRRDWLRITAGAGAAIGLSPRVLEALQARELVTHAIPSSGERIPVIGLGGRWISSSASPEELAGHRAVLHALAEGAEGAGWVLDTDVTPRLSTVSHSQIVSGSTLQADRTESSTDPFDLLYAIRYQAVDGSLASGRGGRLWGHDATEFRGGGHGSANSWPFGSGVRVCQNWGCGRARTPGALHGSTVRCRHHG